MNLPPALQRGADALWSPIGPLAEFPLWVQFLLAWFVIDLLARFQLGGGYPGENVGLVVAFAVGVAALAAYPFANPSGYDDEGGDADRE